ncbi:hypothetical protein [Phormidesmis priestleyi]|uniref:hypothetical protein n=1 Tax=Phormidesmis priestleyi TaxID=268141 RepID=UPI00083B2F5F|nr:hypothetical protein [Phormidesmis priestleyi]
MERSTIADLITARFDLSRALLQLQEGQRSCCLAAMELQIAAAKTDLALIHHAQAQLKGVQTNA